MILQRRRESAVWFAQSGRLVAACHPDYPPLLLHSAPPGRDAKLVTDVSSDAKFSASAESWHRCRHGGEKRV